MISEKIEKLVLESLLILFPDIQDFEILIEIPKDRNYGDYSTGVALKIAKRIQANPMEVANKISEKIGKIQEIEKIEAVSPGFINFFVSKDFLEKELKNISKEKERYGSSEQGKGKKMVIDYSSPNIAKSFGVGHLRSTIIGQAIYNIYKFRGWETIGDNHLGDWGTQFGKLIYQIKEKKLKNVDEKDVDNVLKSLTIKELEDLYVDFHKEVKDSPEKEDYGREWFKKLELGDKEALNIWNFCINISVNEFNRIYEILGVEIDNALGESFYSEMKEEIIEELKLKNVLKESEGALIVEFSEKLPPVIAVKSDGSTTYLARDLATIKYRIEKWNPDLFIYEVGADQSLYFKQLFETAKMLGWLENRYFKHIAHGLVRWKHGKFSTRKGDTIHLEEILNESIKKSLEILEKSETTKNLSCDEKNKTAREIGIGAVKYNDLSQHYSKDIIFEWDKILNLRGNSGPYIQYTFARSLSVLKKGNFNFDDFDLPEINKEEESVLRLMIKFPLIVKEAEKSFSPHLICGFLFDLSQQYNSFYNNHQIIVEDKNEKNFRLFLTSGVAQTIKNGLNLLGIGAPEKM
jgi:arginyl-tRNA synthetase